MFSGLRAEGEEAAEKEWPACDSAATDKTATNPLCDRKYISSAMIA